MKEPEKIFACLTFTFLSVLSFSCMTVPMYIPNTIQTPVFNDKNEVHISTLVGFNGLNLQSSYLLTKNIGFFSDYSLINGTGKEQKKKHHEHNFIDGGIIYNYNFSETADEADFISLDIFTGFGHGTSKGDVNNVFVDTSTVFTNSDFNRYSIQINLVYKEKNPLNFAISGNTGLTLRISAVDFYNFKSEIKNVNKHFTNYYLEYGGFSQMGFKNFKAELQAFLLAGLKKELDTRTIFFYLSLGFHINFSL